MSSINSLRYIRDYLNTKDQIKMIPNVLRPGGAELKPRGSISMAMAVRRESDKYINDCDVSTCIFPFV